ncbi:MAG: PHP domain-containing protein [Burkholderiales bacterium]
MNAYYDLHIHSCLSPCASDDMTPANIAAMAHLKGLNIISLTDHNAGNNLEPMSFEAEKQGIIFVPGIEVTTREEVHVLVYFSSLEPALNFCEAIYDSLPDIPAQPEIFGEQIIIDKNDEISGRLDKLLLQASSFTIDDIAAMAKEAGGCAVPAHINRDSFSVISNLGFIPPGLFGCVEIAKSLPYPAVSPEYKVLYSSDAHNLGDISEPLNALSGISSPEVFISYIANK